MEHRKQPVRNLFRLLFSCKKKASNYIIGMGSILDISGNYFDEKKESSNECTDLLAMYSDWEAVGNDLKKSMEIHLSEIKDPILTSQSQFI